MPPILDRTQALSCNRNQREPALCKNDSSVASLASRILEPVCDQQLTEIQRQWRPKMESSLSLWICHFRSFPDRTTAKLSKRVVGFLFYYQQGKKPTSRAGPTKRQRHDSLRSSLSNGKRKLCCHLLMGHSSRTIRRCAERGNPGTKRGLR